MDRKEHIEKLFGGVDFSAGLPRQPSVPALLTALQSKDSIKIREASQKVSATLVKSNLITQWLNENFSEQGGDVLWEAGLVNPAQMWSYALGNRLGEQIDWCLKSQDRIERIFEPNKPGKDSPTAKDWVNELKIMAKMAPDVYLRATENACWGKLLSYRRAGDPNILLEAWVEAFVNSSIQPARAAESLSRVFTPQVATLGLKARTENEIIQAYAAMIDPLRARMVQADLSTATRLQDLIASSPVLGYAWSNYYNNFQGHFYKRAGYTRGQVHYSLPLTRWPGQYEAFYAQNIMEDLLSQGSPALCSLINKSAPPTEDPHGVNARVCQAISKTPLLGYLFLKRLPSTQAPNIAAKFAVWLPKVKLCGAGLAHWAIIAHPTAAMASALCRCSVSERVLYRVNDDGMTVLDLYKSLGSPSESTLNKVLSSRAQKVRKSLMKLASPAKKVEKIKPYM